MSTTDQIEKTLESLPNEEQKEAIQVNININPNHEEQTRPPLPILPTRIEQLGRRPPTPGIFSGDVHPLQGTNGNLWGPRNFLSPNDPRAVEGVRPPRFDPYSTLPEIPDPDA